MATINCFVNHLHLDASKYIREFKAAQVALASMIGKREKATLTPLKRKLLRELRK